MLVWDEAKNSINAAKHGLSFDAALEFDWSNPVIVDRSRHGDNEQRYAAIGLLRGKLHTIIFTRRGEDIWLISLRRANGREEKTYAEK